MFTAEHFTTALDAEVKAKRPLIPSDPLLVMMYVEPTAGEWAARRTAGDFYPVPHQTVSVRKVRHGVRPVAELSVRERLLYRAFVQRWSDQLPAPDRGQAAFDSFLRGPLDDEKASYVVSSDVTSFYEYVDYALLGRELLSHTGDAEGSDALLGLLEALTQRSFGLPQQSESSDVLAEVYISVVQRRLARQGLSVWRYNDDWRLTAHSWSAALDAVDRLEREARRLGLVLNDSKTIIRKRDTYEEGLDRHERLLKEIADDAELDLTEFTMIGYDEVEWIEPEEDAVRAEAAKRVLLRWAEHRDEDVEHRDVSAALRQLLPTALATVKADPADEEILDVCAEFLRKEQSMTTAVASFYRRAIEHDADAVLTSFEALLGENPYLTPWQAWWIGPVIGEAANSYSTGSQQQKWLADVWANARTPEPVKARLAPTLARKGIVGREALQEAFDDMTEIGQPDIARALGALLPATDPVAASLRAEDDLMKWAFDMGALGV